jgi:hypothetical protein
MITIANKEPGLSRNKVDCLNYLEICRDVQNNKSAGK